MSMDNIAQATIGNLAWSCPAFLNATIYICFFTVKRMVNKKKYFLFGCSGEYRATCKLQIKQPWHSLVPKLLPSTKLDLDLEWEKKKVVVDRERELEHESDWQCLLLYNLEWRIFHTRWPAVNGYSHSVINKSILLSQTAVLIQS